MGRLCLTTKLTKFIYRGLGLFVAFVNFVVNAFFHRETIMPYVNIRIAGTLTREQKARIAAEITDTLERIALKPKSYTYIAFDELPDQN